MSRVDSVKVAAMKAILPLKDFVVASDAFFPFPEGLEQAAHYGATAAIGFWGLHKMRKRSSRPLSLIALHSTKTCGRAVADR